MVRCIAVLTAVCLAAFGDASSLSKACAADRDATPLAPSVALLDTALGQLTSENASELTLPLGATTWRLVWRHDQWWLAAIE